MQSHFYLVVNGMHKAHVNLEEIGDQQAMIILSMVDINGLIGMR